MVGIFDNVVKNKNFILAGALVVGVLSGHATALSGTNEAATVTSGSLPGITVERDTATVAVNYSSNLIVSPIGDAN